jgi:hypothetical protein
MKMRSAVLVLLDTDRCTDGLADGHSGRSNGLIFFATLSCGQKQAGLQFFQSSEMSVGKEVRCVLNFHS